MLLELLKYSVFTGLALLAIQPPKAFANSVGSPSRADAAALDFLSGLDLTPNPAPASNPNTFSISHQFRNIGTLLNVPGQPWPADVIAAISLLENTIAQLNLANPWRDEFHWIVELRDSSTPMLAAELFSNETEPRDYEQLKAIYNIADGKPLAFIQVSTPMLRIMQTKSQLAFALGHEITHHTEGHTQGTGVAHQIHAQSNETVADKGSLILMAGRLRLEAANTALLNLVTAAEAEKSSAEMTSAQQISAIGSALTEDHHHAGLRLAMLLNQVQTMISATPTLGDQEDEVLPVVFRRLSATYTGRMPGDVKLRMVSLLRELTSVHGAILSGQAIDKFENLVKLYPDLWSYSDAVKILGGLCRYLENASMIPQTKGEIILLFLVGDPRARPWEINRSLSKADPALKERVSALLLGFDPNSSLQSILIGTDRFDRWRIDRIGGSSQLAELIENLGTRSRNWKSFLTKLHDLSVPKSSTALSLGFPAIDNLRTEWGLSEGLRYFQVLERLSDADFSDEVMSANLPKILVKLKNPEVYQRLATRIEKSRLDAAIFRVESKIDAHYLETVRDAVAVSKPDSRFIFFSAWLGRCAVSPSTYFTQDLDLFLNTLLAEGVGRLSVLRYGVTANWEELNVRLLRYVLGSAKFSPTEKLQLLAQLQELADDDDFAGVLALGDPSFRKQLVTLFAQAIDPIHQIWLTKADPQASFSFTPTLVKTVRLFYSLGLTQGYFQSSSGAGDLDMLVRENEEILRKHSKSSPAGDIRSGAEGFLPSASYARLLLDWTLAQAKSKGYGSPEAFQIVQRTLRIISSRYHLPPELLAETAKFTTAHLVSVQGMALIEELKKFAVRRSLGEGEFAELLGQAIVESNDQPLAQLWANMGRAFDFAGSGRELALSVRHIVAEKNRLQPAAAGQSLPIDDAKDTRRAENFSLMIRLWSGFVTMIQAQDLDGQMAALDYFMGRTSQSPVFIQRLHVQDQGKLNLLRQAEDLRSELSAQNSTRRAFFVNSCLEGPRAKIMAPENRSALVARLLANIPAGKREVVSDIILSMLEAEGPRASVLLSQELSKKSLSEAMMVESALQNYFVPGIKFAQYLAFTGQFKEYDELLASFQDSAPVPGYFDILSYLHLALGKHLDLSQIFVTRVLGAGTVNMAIEYIEVATGNERVIHIPRQYIEGKTAADFKRFEKFAARLATRSSATKDYSFVLGLVDLIHDSINLEFDRPAAYQRQQEAFEIYREWNVPGWKLQGVDAGILAGPGILMGKAPGITARKLWQTDPALYKKLMGGLYDMEFARILKAPRMGQGGVTVIRLANPDLHDGQVLIDKASHTVTVIDFGQSLVISRDQIDLALDLLALLTGVKSKTSGLALLNQWLDHSHAAGRISKEEFDSIVNYPEPMDRFIRLISKMNLLKAPLPLESVHLILQLNRLVKLGQKVGRSPQLTLGSHLIWRELQSRFTGGPGYSLPPPRTVQQLSEPKEWRTHCVDLLRGK